MKFFAIKSEQDQFERAQQELERDLTPKERRWLRLTDELLKVVEKRLLRRKLSKTHFSDGSKAA